MTFPQRKEAHQVHMGTYNFHVEVRLQFRCVHGMPQKVRDCKNGDCERKHDISFWKHSFCMIYIYIYFLWFMPGSSKCVKFVPFHPKNPPKNRHSTIYGRSRYMNINSFVNHVCTYLTQLKFPTFDSLQICGSSISSLSAWGPSHVGVLDVVLGLWVMIWKPILGLIHSVWPTAKRPIDPQFLFAFIGIIG